MPPKPSKARIGAVNRNSQRLLKKTKSPGTDHRQYIWEVRCDLCGTEYAVNGSDYHLRKCPDCQGGRPSSVPWPPKKVSA